jgi:hypothetical protein
VNLALQQAGLVLGLVTYAFALAIAARTGPLTGAPATIMWLATSALRRGSLLRPTAVAVLGLGGLGGFLHGVVIAVAVRPSWPMTLALLVVGMAGGLATASLAVLFQATTRRATTLLNAMSLVLGVLAAAVALPWFYDRASAVAWSGPWGWPLALHELPTPAAWRFAAGFGAIAVLSAVAAMCLVPRIRLADLAAGADGVAAAAAGVASVEPGLALRIAEERSWANRSFRRTGLPRLAAGGAVVGHDLRTLSRGPGRVALMVGIAVVPSLVVDLLGKGPLLAAVWLACALISVGLLTSNARRDRDMPELGRMLALSPRRLVSARIVVPAAAAALWGALSLGVLGAYRFSGTWWEWALLGLATGPAVGAAALRSARRGSVRHHYPPLVTPSGGVIPLGPVFWFAAGPDIGVAFLLPALVCVAVGAAGPLAIAQVVTSIVGAAAFLRVAGGGSILPKQIVALVRPFVRA